MTDQSLHINNETLAATAFTAQSGVFDDLYGTDAIIRYKRQRVRAHVEQILLPASHILELNAGTGEDAFYFASKGHRIHATDIAPGMLGKLAEKIAQREGDHITCEACSFVNLDRLKQKGPYDMIFSNFAGLNCTNELGTVLRSFAPLLKPNGIVTLVLLPAFCLWETMLLFKGQFGTAFRRPLAVNGAKAKVEDHPFTCWYYHPSYVRKILEDEFELIQTEGLCTVVPPSYMEGFAEKHPKLFHRLAGIENKWKNKWPWKFIGDYYIISFRKK